MMKKKILLFFTISVFAATSAFCQSVHPELGTPATNPNYVHDRITNLYEDSKDVKVSNETIIVLKNHAIKLKMQEERMMRNIGIFRILENKDLKLEDRIWVADFFITGDFPSFPVAYGITLRDGMKAQLASQKN